MAKLNLDAPAVGMPEDAEADIFDHVFRDAAVLPEESARPFAAWLDGCWNLWNEDEDKTNGDVIAGALAFWRGQ